MPSDSAMLFLLRYGEIGLKSPYVLRQLLDRLVSNIQDQFQASGVECIVRREFGRVFLSAADTKHASEILGRTFGVVSFSPVEETSSDLVEITKAAVTQTRTIAAGKSFAVRARRAGDQGPRSMEIAKSVGRAVLDSIPGSRVNLDTPEVELSVEVRGPRAYIFTETMPGPGGLPLGSQGKVSVLIDGPEGAIAAWLMMKRGCRTLLGGPEADRWCRPLRRFDPRLRIFPANDLHELEEVTVGKGSKALVVGWDLERVVTLQNRGVLRIFHPLVGFDQRELESLASVIGLNRETQ